MSVTKSSKPRWCLLPVFLAVLLLLTGKSYGQDEWEGENGDYKREPKLKVTLPSKTGVSQYYYVQPVNVSLTNMDASDGLIALMIAVTTNPQEKQQVLSARFATLAHVTAIGTRLRLAGNGQAVVNAQVKTRSGKEITTTGKIQVDEGVDFSDEVSLTKRLPVNVKGLQGPVGTARARIWKKGKYERQFSAIIYHPMLPQNGEQRPNRLERMDIQYRGSLFGEIEFGDAMSNDPYIDIRFTDQQPGSGPIRVQWKDSTGKIFEPEKTSAK
jgi:hypothetical protein